MIQRVSHTAAAVQVTKDVSEVVLFGGFQCSTGLIGPVSGTTIIRLGKLCINSDV